MRAAAAVLGAMVGVLLISSLGWFLLVRKPLIATPNSVPGSVGNGSASTPTESGAGNQNNPLTPMANADRQRADIDKKRLPLFHLLRDKYDKLIYRVAVLDDLETLDIVLTKPDNETIALLVSEVVQPVAKKYAFRRFRWYERTPSNSQEPVHNVAETSMDDSGRWNTFWK